MLLLRTSTALRALLSRLSLKGRLAAIAALVVALAVALVATAAFAVVRGQLRQQVDASLVQQAQSLQAQGGRGPGGLGRLLAPVPDQAGRPRLAPLFSAVVLVDTAGASTPVGGGLGTANVRDGSAFASVATGADRQVLRDAVLGDGTHVRAIAVPVQVTVDGTTSDYALVLARSLAETDATLSRLRLLLVVAGGLGVLLAAVGGLGVARAGLRPVDRLTAAAEHVARTEELDVPIEVAGHDEVARLARSFNAMTGALALSRERQRQLVADAGHELRTPLTSLRTNIELLVRSERSGRGLPPEDRRRLHEDLAAQIGELGTLVGELTDLARATPAVAEPQSLDLAEVAGRAVDRARLRAGEVDLLADLQPWQVQGNPVALERAILNLIDNAVKFSPPGGAVRVYLAAGQLTVTDTGPGISPEDAPHVFERFYRATAARSLPGSGLGLAIVARAVEQHGGAVRLEPSPGGVGTTARLWLPGTAYSPLPAA